MADAANIQIGLAGGLDETYDPVRCPPDRLLKADNVVVDDSGAIQMRNGTDAISNGLSGGGTFSYGAKVFGYKQQLLISNGDTLYAYSPTSQLSTAIGRVTPCTLTRKEIGPGDDSGGTEGVFGAVAETNGFQCRVWTNGEAVLASIVDTATGA